MITLSRRETHTAFIGIGSNQGDRMANCTSALKLLSTEKGIEVVRVSRWYESEALTDAPPFGQPPFINAAAHVTTSLRADELMALLLRIETKLGRPYPRPKGEQRTIDLDLLLYDDLTLHIEGLDLPHPELAKRLFVLLPLCDIAPDAIHPATGLTVRDLASRCQRSNPTFRIAEWIEPWTED